MIEDFAQLLLELAEHFGIAARVSSMHRSRHEQERLYAERNKPGKLPTARPGTSTHEYGLAFDVVAVSREDQEFLGLLGEAIGLTWGGRFSRPDPVHFQIVSVDAWAGILAAAGL